MKRRRWILALFVIIVALFMLFGCGACCMLSPHRCAEKTKRIELPIPANTPFPANGITHCVFEFGTTGPDVILLHELPGFTPATIKLAVKLGKAGYKVHVPLIFGDFNTKGATLAGFGKCFFSEFNCLGNGESRFAGWLRALIAARYQHGVIVVGMCMTGSTALQVADAPGVTAVVMAQPSLPLPLTRWQRPKIGVSDKHAAKIKTPILAMRYSEDCMATRERFATLKATFPATQIEFEEVPSAQCRAAAHATLTGDYSEQAYAHLITFLSTHTKP
jgi:dienelactone hydrolase